MLVPATTPPRPAMPRQLQPLVHPGHQAMVASSSASKRVLLHLFACVCACVYTLVTRPIIMFCSIYRMAGRYWEVMGVRGCCFCVEAKSLLVRWRITSAAMW